MLFKTYAPLFVALAGRGGRPLRCRAGFRGRAESGEHLGPRAEAGGGPVHGQLQFLRPRERDLLAGEQRRSVWAGRVQAALGGVSGAAAQRLKDSSACLSSDQLVFPSVQHFFYCLLLL